MTNEVFSGLKIAILVDDGFEQAELADARKALDQAGAETRVVSPKDQWVRGWNSTEWGDELRVDVSLDQARPYDFDVLIVPGGVPAAEALRMQTDAVRLLAAGFVQAFLAAQKPVAVNSFATEGKSRHEP
ncbi:MAG: DJ-1/PfpI family protein [Gammaproteobacteria bacterium]